MSNRSTLLLEHHLKELRLPTFLREYRKLAAQCAAVKSLDTFDFLAIPSVNKQLVHELMEARDDRRLLNRQRQLARLRLLIIDELGFVPLSTTGAELLFEVFSQRYERGSVLVTTNLPFDEWTDVFGSERLTGALLDRLTHHVHILEMNGDSYRLKHSRQSAASQVSDDPVDS